MIQLVVGSLGAKSVTYITCRLRLQLPSLERASLHLGHTSYAYVTITKPHSASLRSAKKTIDVAGVHRYNRVYPKAEVSTILAKYIIDNAVHKI